jgi:hypothetical protein
MVRFVALLGLSVMALTAACVSIGANVNVSTSAPHGDYVEARTATVFAGPCHYASEREMMGREAVMAWNVKSGSWNGVDLTGVKAVAAVAAERNLEDDAAPRSSILFVNHDTSLAQRRAMVSWVRSNHATVLGNVLSVQASIMTFEIDGDRFTVKADCSVELEGKALENRRCGNMPSEIWYTPLSPMRTRFVGSVETFRQTEYSLQRAFSYPADNCAFVGTF